RDGQSVLIARGALHIFRTKFLLEGICYDRIRVSNFSLRPIPVTVLFQIESDFADIFEVRGARRERKGTRLATQLKADEMVLAYEGLDGVIRQTRISCLPTPKAITAGRVEFATELPPKAEAVFIMTAACEVGASQ